MLTTAAHHIGRSADRAPGVERCYDESARQAEQVADEGDAIVKALGQGMLMRRRVE